MAMHTDEEDSGGYNYSFVEPLHDRYMCIICHLPSRDPQMTGECCRGQILCKTCLDRARKAVPANSCPICRSTEGFVTYPNFHLNREIRSLHIYCTKKENGCEWQGELNNINDHLKLGNSNAGCQFQEVQCTNGCGEWIERRHLTTHNETECRNRKVNCRYCHRHVTMYYQQLEQRVHLQTCPRVPISCPNNCELREIPREDMEKHKRECQLEIINCSNNCGRKLERRYLTNHIKNECTHHKVSCPYCHLSGDRQFVVGQHTELCSSFPVPCPNNCEVATVPRRSLKAHRNKCPLEVIDCEYCTLGCEVRLPRKDLVKHKREKIDDHLIMATCKLDDVQRELTNTKTVLSELKDSVKSTTELKQELMGVKRQLDTTKHELSNIKYQLERELSNTKYQLDTTKHELQDANYQLNTTKHELTDTKLQLDSMSKQMANLTILLHTQLKSSISASTIDIVAEAKPSIKLNAMATMFKFGDDTCPVVLKMSEYSKRKNNNEQWFSDPFYTHHQGYRMRLSVVPAGFDYGKGTHLSLCLHLMQGPHDEKLNWPLRERFEILLMNQIDSSNHHSCTIVYDATNNLDKKGKGNSRFISNTQLQKTTATQQFIKDNCVFFQITKL